MCRSTLLEEYFSAVPRPTVPPKQRSHRPSLTPTFDCKRINQKRKPPFFYSSEEREWGGGVNPLLPQMFVSMCRGWERGIQFLLWACIEGGSRSDSFCFFLLHAKHQRELMQKSKREEMRGQFDFFFFFTAHASLQGVRNNACSQHKREESKEAVTITKTSNRISVVHWHWHGQKTEVKKLSGRWLCLRTYDYKQTKQGSCQEIITTW